MLPRLSRVHRRGFTLIELLVAITIIGVLTALLLPAVGSAREAMRRAKCMNNLKQLALAVSNYEGSNGCLPMGTPLWHMTDVGDLFENHSLLVATLPYYEQQALYYAVNFNTNIYTYSNLTVQNMQLAMLMCPSDFQAEERESLPYDVLGVPAGMRQPGKSSYGGCAGVWYDRTLDPSLARYFEGAFHINSAVRWSEFTDGTSATLLLGERAHSKLKPSEAADWHWWYDGYMGDTLFWTLYPMNPYEKVETIDANVNTSNAYINAAGSMHPQGANFAFADGSVRFIKETIETLNHDPSNGIPSEMYLDDQGVYRLKPGERYRVWQAISTRKHGEIISSDDY